MSARDTEQTYQITDKSLIQSGALAVQDAANSYQDISSFLTTASGVTLSKTGNSEYLMALDKINEQSQASRNNFIELYSSVNNTRAAK